MDTFDTTSDYQIWGADGVVYGPVDLPTLTTWIADERVTGDTWIYHEGNDAWSKAADLAELRSLFETAAASSPEKLPPTHPSSAGIDAKALRRMKIFSNLEDNHLQEFLNYMEVAPVTAWKLLVKQGDPGDAMYLVLAGEVRVRLLISDKETLLATLGPGDFFGEVALFDHGPRSADVVANQESLLLKVSVANFQRLMREAPQIAAPFLLSICKTLTARIRADNKRLRESIKAFRAVGQYNNV